MIAPALAIEWLTPLTGLAVAGAVLPVLVLLYFFVQPSKDDGNPYRAA